MKTSLSEEQKKASIAIAFEGNVIQKKIFFASESDFATLEVDKIIDLNTGERAFLSIDLHIPGLLAKAREQPPLC